MTSRHGAHFPVIQGRERVESMIVGTRCPADPLEIRRLESVQEQEILRQLVPIAGLGVVIRKN
jgi:hypothetical protein